MSNFVALELNTEQLMVVSAKSSGRDYQITGAFTIEISPDLTDMQISERLKGVLSRRGISRSETMFVVNRQNVEIREISVPPAPDEEMPELVRFQARNEFASLNESWSLDFVPFEGIEGGPRRVLATALSPQLMGQLTTIAESAGLRLKRILFRPYALCDLLQARLSDRKLRLIVDPNEDQIDLNITNGVALVATRSLRRQNSTDEAAQIKQLLGEVKRTLASSSSELGNKSIEEILICGLKVDYELLADQLFQTFNYPVKCVDPTSCLQSGTFAVQDPPPQIERFASLMGALAQECSRQRHRVDFLNPRKTVVRTIDRKRTTIYAGSAAALVLLAIVCAWWVLSSQDRKLETLNNQLAQIIRQNEGENGRPGVDQIIGEVSRIDDWVVWDVDWLEELSQVSQRFMTPDDAIVDNFTAELGNDSAQMILKGRMAEIDSGTELKSELATRPYTVKSGRTLRLDDDSDYQLSIEANLSIEQDRAEVLRNLNELARNRHTSESTVDTSKNPDARPE